MIWGDCSDVQLVGGSVDAVEQSGVGTVPLPGGSRKSRIMPDGAAGCNAAKSGPSFRETADSAISQSLCCGETSYVAKCSARLVNVEPASVEAGRVLDKSL